MRSGWFSAWALHTDLPVNRRIIGAQDPLQCRALVLKKKSKREHVTSLLTELHWLPVKYRIQNKLAFCHFDGTLPSHLAFSSLHILTIALLSFLDRTTAGNSEDKHENFWWTFFWLHRSDCLELSAGRPERLTLPPNSDIFLTNVENVGECCKAQ